VLCLRRPRSSSEPAQTPRRDAALPGTVSRAISLMSDQCHRGPMAPQAASPPAPAPLPPALAHCHHPRPEQVIQRYMEVPCRGSDLLRS
jgi:hypothetical protein